MRYARRKGRKPVYPPIEQNDEKQGWTDSEHEEVIPKLEKVVFKFSLLTDG